MFIYNLEEPLVFVEVVLGEESLEVNGLTSSKSLVWKDFIAKLATWVPNAALCVRFCKCSSQRNLIEWSCLALKVDRWKGIRILKCWVQGSQRLWHIGFVCQSKRCMSFVLFVMISTRCCTRKWSYYDGRLEVSSDHTTPLSMVTQFIEPRKYVEILQLNTLDKPMDFSIEEVINWGDAFWLILLPQSMHFRPLLNKKEISKARKLLEM